MADRRFGDAGLFALLEKSSCSCRSGALAARYRGAVQREWMRTWPNRVMDTLPLLRFRFVLRLLSDGSWRRPIVFTSGDDGVVGMSSLRKR